MVFTPVASTEILLPAKHGRNRARQPPAESCTHPNAHAADKSLIGVCAYAVLLVLHQRQTGGCQYIYRTCWLNTGQC